MSKKGAAQTPNFSYDLSKLIFSILMDLAIFNKECLSF